MANGRIGDAHDPATLTDGFSAAFQVGAGFALFGALLALVLIRGRDSRAHRDSAMRGDAQVAPAAA